MSRETQHVLLLLLGGALLRIAVDDTVLRYVRPSHRWLVVAAGAVAVVLAVVALVRDRTGPPTAEHHGSAERLAPWLLLLPVLVIALVAPPALGADAVARSGSRNAVVQDSDAFAPIPPGAAPELAVAEFVQRAVWDSTGTLDGREVTLTGFAVRRGAAVDLARLTISCCAADARPSVVRLVDELDGVTDDTWLRVRGTLDPDGAPGHPPAMVVSAAEVVPAPTDPYEY